MPQEFSRSRAEQDIREAMLCPVDWAAVFRVEAPAVFEPLQALWHEILKENARGDEARYVSSDHWLASLSEESDAGLQAMQLNVDIWKETAHNRFLSAIRRFTALRYASRQVYGKHLPPPGPWPGGRRVDQQSNKRGISIFYFDIPEEAALIAFLLGIFWTFSAYRGDFGVVPEAERLWGKILNDPTSRVCFRCSGPIRASEVLQPSSSASSWMRPRQLFTGIRSPRMKLFGYTSAQYKRLPNCRSGSSGN
jgi:hypothetical protein